jgi:hypothetical protein
MTKQKRGKVKPTMVWAVYNSADIGGFAHLYDNSEALPFFQTRKAAKEEYREGKAHRIVRVFIIEDHAKLSLELK